MTNIILDKVSKVITEKKNKKLEISRFKQKNRFKDGVLNLPKNFMKYDNK